jgi:hypothetical protein
MVGQHLRVGENNARETQERASQGNWQVRRRTIHLGGRVG